MRQANFELMEYRISYPQPALFAHRASENTTSVLFNSDRFNDTTHHTR